MNDLDSIHPRINKSASDPIAVSPIANASILLRIGWLNLMLLIFPMLSHFISRFTQMFFKIFWSFLFSTFFLIIKTIPEMPVTRKTTDKNTGQNIFITASVSIHSPVDATSKNIPWRNPKNIPKPRGKMSTKNNYRTRHIYTLAAHATFGEVDKQTSRRLTSATCTTVHVIFYREIYI